MKKGPQPEDTPTIDGYHLHRATTLVNSLVSDSQSATAFVGKWQSIRTKLTRLSSGLSSSTTDLTTSPQLLHLLHSITQTVSRIRTLVPICSEEDLHLSCGKLLTKSNLDRAVTELDLHLRSLSDVYASGVLRSHSSAIVASRPPPDATRDEMRFYVRDLSLRLDVGDLHSRNRALSSLQDLLREDDRYLKIVINEARGILHTLVTFLESGDLDARAEAAGAASCLAGRSEGKAGLIASGALGPLVAAVEVGTYEGRERAARALAKLTENGDNAWAVAAHGGASALLGIVDSEAGGGDLPGAACAALRNLAGVAEVRDFLVEQGAVSVFLRLLLACREETLQLQAIDFLRMVAAGEPDEALRGGTVLGFLLSTLDPESGFSAKMQAAALQLAEVLCIAAAGAVAWNGFLERVLGVMRGGEAELREAALGAAARLCETASEEKMRVMGEMGFMEEMVRAMERGPTNVREAAARALAGMVAVGRNGRRLAEEEESVGRLVRVLEEEVAAGRGAARGMLLAALAKVSECGSGRRRIAASCDVGSLETMEEGDAKEIARNISKGGRIARWRKTVLGILRF